MKNIDPIAISKLAVRTFISKSPPKISADTSPHPLVKYLQGTRATQETIVTYHTEVESVLIILHDQLSELFIPTLYTDFNPATYSTMICLGGAKGYQVIYPYPTSFEADILFADFTIFHDEKHHNDIFFKGAPRLFYEHPVLIVPACLLPNQLHCGCAADRPFRLGRNKYLAFIPTTNFTTTSCDYFLVS